MDMRGRDGGEARRAAAGVGAAGFEMANRSGVNMGESVGQALALSEAERQSRQAEVVSEELMMLGREAQAIFGQERIENEVARETGLISGENVEQAGAESELLVNEREAADAYDLATEQGLNGREAQQILLDSNEKAAERAQRVVGNFMNRKAEECNLSEVEGMYRSLRQDVMEAFGESLGGRN